MGCLKEEQGMQSANRTTAAILIGLGVQHRSASSKG